MFVKSTIAIASSVALLANAQTSSGGDFKVIVPGGSSLWWVANAQNNIVWACQNSPAQTFEILLANKDPKILAQATPIVASINNADCTHTLAGDQVTMPAAPGYTLQLANPLNQTQVYAQSDEFEIKAANSPYPDTSATPTVGATSASGASGSATGAAASSSSTTSSAAKTLSSSLSTWVLGAIGAAVYAVYGM